MDAPSQCRALAVRARYGALATLSRDRSGFPFATLVAVAFDDHLRPLLCLSTLAEHTKNLHRVSSRLDSRGRGPRSGVDPLGVRDG